MIELIEVVEMLLVITEVSFSSGVSDRAQVSASSESKEEIYNYINTHFVLKYASFSINNLKHRDKCHQKPMKSYSST